MRLRIKTTNKLLEPVIMLLSFFLGFEEGGFQLILLSIANEFELSNASMGSLVSVQYAAIIIAPLMFRNFADKVGKKIITVLFAMVFIVGCFTIIWTLSIIVVIIGIFILGCGFSVCESSVIAALADSYGIRSGKYINISQSFFSVGAVVSPLITNFGMVYLGVDWRVVFAISGCGYLFLMIPLLFTKFAIDIPIQSLSDYRRFTTFSMILFPTFLCLLVTILIYVSMENGLTFFLDSMFIKVLDAPKLAAFSISLFWLAMVPSRLLASLFNRHQITLLIFCFFGSTVLLIILALNSSPYISLAICFALGLFFGPIWPTAMSIATQEFPSNSGRVTSLMLSFSGVGGAFSPIVMGSLADVVSFKASYLSLSLFAIVGLTMILVYIKMKKSRFRK